MWSGKIAADWNWLAACVCACTQRRVWERGWSHMEWEVLDIFHIDNDNKWLCCEYESKAGNQFSLSLSLSWTLNALCAILLFGNHDLVLVCAPVKNSLTSILWDHGFGSLATALIYWPHNHKLRHITHTHTKRGERERERKSHRKIKAKVKKNQNACTAVYTHTKTICRRLLYCHSVGAITQHCVHWGSFSSIMC